MVVVCMFDGVGLLVGGEGENELAAMETGGAGHHGGLVMTRLRLSVSGGRAWLTDRSRLGEMDAAGWSGRIAPTTPPKPSGTVPDNQRNGFRESAAGSGHWCDTSATVPDGEVFNLIRLCDPPAIA